MKRKWKILITLVAVVFAAVGVYASTVHTPSAALVTVQTGRVVRQDLTSLVTASGEIKPKNYINIGANAMGELTEILVKEGDHVRKGQLLAKIEDVQPGADLEAQKATLSSAEADSAASEAGLKAADENVSMAQAALTQARAELDRAKADFDRAEAQFKEQLARPAGVRSKQVHLRGAEGRRSTGSRPGWRRRRPNGSRPPPIWSSSQKRIALAKANLARFTDVLEKRNSFSPIDGVVTNLPVRVGETVVPGLQNQTGTLIMTIADMSLITAEVKVDETDIVNVKLGQVAEITIDAIPEQDLQGPRDRDREHGDPAVHRRGGLAKRHFEPGSEGFQGGDRPGQPAGRNSPRTFLHRKDNHSHPSERPYYSDPGADGSAEGRFGA